MRGLIASASLILLTCCASDAPSSDGPPSGDGPPPACPSRVACAAPLVSLEPPPGASWAASCALPCGDRGDCPPGAYECVRLAPALPFACLARGNPLPCPGLPFDPLWGPSWDPAGAPPPEACDGDRQVDPWADRVLRAAGTSAVPCPGGCLPGSPPSCLP